MRKNWGKKRDEGLIKARRVDWEGKFIGKTHIEEIKRGGKGEKWSEAKSNGLGNF